MKILLFLAMISMGVLGTFLFAYVIGIKLGPPVFFRFGDKNRYVVFNPLRDKGVERLALIELTELKNRCAHAPTSDVRCEQLNGRLNNVDFASLRLFDRRDAPDQVSLQYSVGMASEVYPLMGLTLTLNRHETTWRLDTVSLIR